MDMVPDLVDGGGGFWIDCHGGEVEDRFVDLLIVVKGWLSGI